MALASGTKKRHLRRLIPVFIQYAGAIFWWILGGSWVDLGWILGGS